MNKILSDYQPQTEELRNFSIDVSNLNAGNYIVKLTTENGTAVKNFIKI